MLKTNYKGYEIYPVTKQHHLGGQCTDYECIELGLISPTLDAMKSSIDKVLESYKDSDNFTRMGFMAKRLTDGALFPFEWNNDDTLSIGGNDCDAEEYEILEIFHSKG